MAGIRCPMVCVQRDGEAGPGRQHQAGQVRSKGRIDLMVALVMALGVSIVAEPPRASVYSTRGVRRLG